MTRRLSFERCMAGLQKLKSQDQKSQDLNWIDPV
jgi:hypothetical protein